MVDDPAALSKGSSPNASRSMPQAGSRYIDGYEPESESAVARPRRARMIEELSLRLSQPRAPTNDMSSGESIMVETMRKSRTRPHDSEWIENLSTPSRTGSTAASWGCHTIPDPLAPPPGSVDFTSSFKFTIKPAKHKGQKLNEVISRLASPKQTMGGETPIGEKIVTESQLALKAKTANVCTQSLIARLSTPRLKDMSAGPAAGESLFLDAMARRPKRAVNWDHLASISGPNRRGGSAHNWIPKNWAKNGGP